MNIHLLIVTAEYRASTLSDILSAKKFIEAIVNSIDDPVIGLNMEREILFLGLK